MKKRTWANFTMVAVIAVMVTGGCLVARKAAAGAKPELGTAFQAPVLEDPALISGAGEESCTISILCQSVLDDPDALAEEKRPYVPADGVILPPTTVAIVPGETAFSLLRRVCQAGDIALECSWTPLYNSYYVEGIGHLYEFDCGPESGWMFQVDGVFPNYGASACTLEAGQTVVWCYTCAGLGADIGGSL